jgi:hypothetical protein
LADTCSFPVDAKNLLVAASGMVAIQLELGIQATELLETTPMTDEVRSGCQSMLHSRAWLQMARLVQKHTDQAMVTLAIRLAKDDLKEHTGGGALLVANNEAHAERLINLIRSAAGHIKTGDFASLESVDASSYGLVVITKDKDRGYNSACRLGVMITGAYAGNGASRHQIRGRLRRLGQKRSVVKFVTFVMENSLLHLLHLRHNAVDSMNISLEQLGQSFSADVLKGLQPGALPFCSSVAQKPSPVK